MNFLQTANRWYEKAGLASDSYDKFISAWISFNAIYGQEDNISEFTEKNKIRNVIRNLRESAVDAVMSLPEVDFFSQINPPISGSRFDTSHQQQMLNRNLNYNRRKGLEHLILILNTVRNNLFHGSKDVNRTRDLEIVTKAYPIVSKLVEEYLMLERPSPRKKSNEGLAENEKQSIIRELEKRLEHIQLNYSLIPKDENHPISILLDHNNLGNSLFIKESNPKRLRESQQILIHKFETNKTEMQKELDEVLRFVKNRVNQAIENGCSAEEMDLLWKEFNNLQMKYREKGYYVH
jgi:hypothetical protein